MENTLNPIDARTAKAKALLERTSIARKFIAKQIELDCFCKDYQVDENSSRRELEEAFFKFAEETYWAFDLMQEERQIFLEQEIAVGHVNTELELDAWETALQNRYEPFVWFYARRQGDKTVFLVDLTKDQFDWAKTHFYSYENACERVLKNRGWICQNSHIDFVSSPMFDNPFPNDDRQEVK